MKKTDRQSGTCAAELGSVTQAMRAQETLAAVAIPCRVIKLEASGRRGCVYGIRFSYHQKANVQRILATAHIAVREWSEEI